MKPYKENTIKTFDKQAETYDERFYGSHARKLYPILLKELHSLEVYDILDLGCGTGEMMKILLDHKADIHLYGLDISSKMIHVANEKLKEKAVLTLGDAEHMPYEDAVFDVVYCNDSFHHYPHPQQVVHEIYRILRPGGIVILGDSWLPIGFRHLMNRLLPFSKEGDVHIYSKREILKLFQSSFQLMKWELLSATAYVMVARKKERECDIIQDE